MPVDSFRFLPRLISVFYQATQLEPELPIPWTPLPRPLEQCTFALVTSGGFYLKRVDAPFDLQKEIENPTWGDPTYREIPQDVQQGQLAVSHLHYNPQEALEDFNILLPLQRFQELVAQRVIGGLAGVAYSFMGYQGFPPDARQWQDLYGPQIAARMKEGGVDCVLLTPA